MNYGDPGQLLIDYIFFCFGSVTGFVGLPAAQACVRAGHLVFGLTRSLEKAKQLTAEESGSTTINSSYRLF